MSLPANAQPRNGQPGFVVWFTGFGGAGKTTLATSVERHLFDRGYRTFLVDGDSLRTAYVVTWALARQIARRTFVVPHPFRR